MIPQYISEYLDDLFDEFNQDMSTLYRDRRLTKADFEKIKNQAVISRNAMLETIKTSSFTNTAQEKLLTAYVKDFENSTQKLIDNVVARSGIRSLVEYRLDIVSRKINFRLKNYQISTQTRNQINVTVEIVNGFLQRLFFDKFTTKLFTRTEIISLVFEFYVESVVKYAESQDPKLVKGWS